MNSRNHTQDDKGLPDDLHTCIFPIMKALPNGETKLVGTGFFLTTLGHFVTAKHVIFDVYNPETKQQTGMLHAVHFVEDASVLVRHITDISYHNSSDIAVGKMDFYVVNSTGLPLTNKMPRFTTDIPAVGSPVLTFAYPESDGFFRKGEMATFRPNFYSGKLLFHSDSLRDSVMVSWPHFGTSINVLGGASGGPVFDEMGRVFGINCVGGYEDLSYMARVQELLELDVPHFPPSAAGAKAPASVRELVELHHIVFEQSVDET